MSNRYEGLDADQIVIQEDAFSNHQPTSTNKKHKVNSNSKWKNKLILVIVLCICYLVYQSWITYMKYQKRHRKHNLKEKQQKSIQNEILMNDSTIIEKQNREKDIIKSQLKQPWKYISEVRKNIKQHQFLSDSLRQYYDRLQQKVQIIKVSYQHQSNQSEQNGLTIIINAIHNYTLNDNFVVSFLESVKSMFNSFYREDSNIKQVQIIWILCVSNNSKIKDMFYNTFDSYKLNSQIKYAENVQSIDSTYEFITKYIQTPNIVYAHSSVKFDQPTITSIRQKILSLNEKEENTVNIYCPSYQQFKWQAGRYDLSEQNINKCMYSYRSMYLKMITPTNFAFQTAYTINQVLIIPVLTLAHMANTIVSHSSTVQKLEDKQSVLSSEYFHNVQFVLAQHQQLISFPPTMCFVGFPALTHSNNYSQIIRYLNSFQNIQIQTSNNYVIILSIVYNHEQPIKLLELLQYIKQLQSQHILFKIKIRDNIVYGPLEVYEAGWCYCPKNSVIISSRFNVNPNLPAIKKSIQQYQLCSSSKWALFGNYQYKQTVTNLQGKIKVEKHQKRRQYDELFHTYLATGQIFCSHLWRTLQVYAVKWQQTEFYQTQYSFAIPLLQKSVSNYAFTADSLFTKHQNLILTQLESQQIDGLRLRKNYLDIPQQKDKPISFNSLINCGLKRNAKQLIPRIMHQIWLSDEQNMSPFKQTLMNTLITTNPQFTHRLWTIHDISRQNFPYTYDGIQKYIKLSKENKKNFRALIADLMRIEILYWYGGIYFDMKVEGRKSLINFLKYEQFFYYSSPESLVNGIIGSIPGNSHFRKILEEYYIPQKLNLPFQHIYDQTGGPVIAKAYNQKQITIQVLNFIQFIGQGQRPCIYQNFNQEPDSNQKVFEGKTAKGKFYRVFIPCKKNLDKYLQLYNVLGRTYFDNAPKYWL